MDGLLDQPAVEVLAFAEAVDGVENHRRRYPLAIAALPAQQRFGAMTATAGDVDLRLQEKLQALMVAQDATQLVEHLARLVTLGFHFRCVIAHLLVALFGDQTGNAGGLDEKERFLAILRPAGGA